MNGRCSAWTGQPAGGLCGSWPIWRRPGSCKSKMHLDQGLIQVYTGSQTANKMAALGQALRAVGHGLAVYVVGFFTSGPEDPDPQTMEGCAGLVCKRFGRRSVDQERDLNSEDARLAQQALNHAREVVTTGMYDLVILDDVNLALEWQLIELDSLLALLEVKPEGVEMILTGCYAHPAVISRADLVTEMRETKERPGNQSPAPA